jgi:hypothetical protein
MAAMSRSAIPNSAINRIESIVIRRRSETLQKCPDTGNLL